MISIFGSSFGVLSPLGLAVGATLVSAALIYAYRRRGRGKKVAVSSTFLLRLIENVPRSRQKFFPPARFFFELLCLLLVLLGVVGLFKSDQGSKTAILLDNSLSMGSIDRTGGDSSDLFEKAKAKIRGELLSITSSGEVSLYSSSPILKSITNGYVSRSDALSALDSVKLSYASDNLDTSLIKIRQDNPVENVWVVTDKIAQSENNTNETNSIKWDTLRSQNDRFANFAIAGLKIETENDITSTKGKLIAKIQSFAETEATLKITLDSCNSLESCKDPSSIDSRIIRIPAFTTREEVFSETALDGRAFRVRIREESRSGITDSLSYDDQAWATQEALTTDILVVSDLTASDLKLSTLRSFNFKTVRPEEFGSIVAADQIKKFRTIIFHRVLPEKLPAVGSIFIMPPSGSEIIDVAELQNNVEITRWQEGDPLLQYVSIAGMRLPQMLPLKPPDWGRPVLFSSSGIVAARGEVGRNRYVFLGLEILPYEGRNAPSLSIFLLNSLKWVTGLSTNAAGRTTYSAYPISEDIESISYWDGEIIYKAGTASSENTSSVSLVRPGVLLVKKKGNTEVFEAVSFFDADESNVNTTRPFVLPKFPVFNERDEKYHEKLTPWLIKIVCFLIMLDLLIVLVKGIWRLRFIKGEYSR